MKRLSDESQVNCEQFPLVPKCGFVLQFYPFFHFPFPQVHIFSTPPSGQGKGRHWHKSKHFRLSLPVLASSPPFAASSDPPLGPVLRSVGRPKRQNKSQDGSQLVQYLSLISKRQFSCASRLADAISPIAAFLTLAQLGPNVTALWLRLEWKANGCQVAAKEKRRENKTFPRTTATETANQTTEFEIDCCCFSFFVFIFIAQNSISWPIYCFFSAQSLSLSLSLSFNLLTVLRNGSQLELAIYENDFISSPQLPAFAIISLPIWLLTSSPRHSAALFQSAIWAHSQESLAVAKRLGSTLAKEAEPKRFKVSKKVKQVIVIYPRPKTPFLPLLLRSPFRIANWLQATKI